MNSNCSDTELQAIPNACWPKATTERIFFTLFEPLPLRLRQRLYGAAGARGEAKGTILIGVLRQLLAVRGCEICSLLRPNVARSAERNAAVEVLDARGEFKFSTSYNRGVNYADEFA